MHFRSFIYGIAASLAFGAAVAVAQNMSLDDLIVANVNGEEITRRQLVARLLEYNGEDTLRKMVSRAILMQGAKRAGVTVTEEEIDAKLVDVKKQFKQPEDFQRLLTQNGLSEKQYRDEIRHTLMLEKAALKEAPITDEDLQQYDVRLIIAPDKAAAEKWVKELDNGADFAKMAAERSQDPNSRKVGGRMRPFIKIELLDVWRAIDDQKLQKGGYTKKPVLLTDASWVLVKLENIIPASSVSAAEKERLSTLITRYRMDQWLEQNRAKAKIAYPVPLAAVIVEKPAGK